MLQCICVRTHGKELKLEILKHKRFNMDGTLQAEKSSFLAFYYFQAMGNQRSKNDIQMAPPQKWEAVLARS